MMRIAALVIAPPTVLVATLTGCGSSSTRPKLVVFAAAQGFVDPVTGEVGRKVLSQAGFGKP